MAITKEEWKTDWRNNGQEEYLKKTLYYKTYKAPSKEWDHDHCVFCWAKISEDEPGALRTGYTDEDDYWWICEECFQDLKDIFAWEVKA